MILQKQKNKSGFTVLELLVTISLSVILAGMTLVTFETFSNYQSLDKDADVVVSYLQEARNQTINSKNDMSYGVAFASSSITLFQGTSYSRTASTNLVYNISVKDTLLAIQLTGGVSSLYFTPITGLPNATGTIKFISKTNASTTKTVTIYGSGLGDAQ